MVYSAFTKNDWIIVSYLARHFAHHESINQLARILKLTPKGLLNALRRLEKHGIVAPTKHVHAVCYHINFRSLRARLTAQLALYSDPQLPYARVQRDDLYPLSSYATSAILFGSVLEKGAKAKDVDLLVILEKSEYIRFRKRLADIQSLQSKTIHVIRQSYDDFVHNLKKMDPVVLAAITRGDVLWGHGPLIDAIAEATEHGACTQQSSVVLSQSSKRRNVS